MCHRRRLEGASYVPYKLYPVRYWLEMCGNAAVTHSGSITGNKPHRSVKPLKIFKAKNNNIKSKENLVSQFGLLL